MEPLNFMEPSAALNILNSMCMFGYSAEEIKNQRAGFKLNVTLKQVELYTKVLNIQVELKP